MNFIFFISCKYLLQIISDEFKKIFKICILFDKISAHWSTIEENLQQEGNLNFSIFVGIFSNAIYTRLKKNYNNINSERNNCLNPLKLSSKTTFTTLIY